jgi:transcriptional antiterminator NusG
MLEQEVRPEIEAAAENETDVLTAASPGPGDDPAEDAQAVIPDTAVEEDAPEAQVSELAEATTDAAEVQAEAPIEEAEAEALTEEVQAEAPIEEAEAEALTEEAQADAPIEEAEAEALAEEAEAEAEVPEPQDNRAWYVIHCYSGYENKVKHNLEQRIETMQMQDQIFQVVVPTEDEIEVRDGKRRVVERRVFPGYILVQMILNDDSWYVVRNTPGATGFVGMGNEPTPLRPEEVQAIMKRMEAEAPKIKVTFKSGQKVRIIDGPFNEFIGMVDEIDMERAKVRVLVSFFGRETPVELDFLQVEKA